MQRRSVEVRVGGHDCPRELILDLPAGLGIETNDLNVRDWRIYSVIHLANSLKQGPPVRRFYMAS